MKNLYNEKINSKKKYKKLKRFHKLLILIGVAIICISIFLMPKFIWWVNHKINASRSEIVINGKEDINLNIENVSTENKQSYQKILDNMKEKAEEISNSLVDIEILNNTLNEKVVNKGIVIGKTKSRYVILTNANFLGEDSQIKVVLGEKERLNGTFLSKNTVSSAALVSIKISDANKDEKIYPIKIASANNMKKGMFVIVYGRINGNDDFLDYGMISSVEEDYFADAKYKILKTNIESIKNDFGFLFNENASLVGLFSNNGDKNILEAITISDLKYLLEKLSNGIDIPYLGVVGKDVTDEMLEDYKLPKGLYVKDVVIDSPSFKAGIQQGDIITKINDDDIFSMNDLNKKLYELSVSQNVKINVKRYGKDGYTDILFNVILGSSKLKY